MKNEHLPILGWLNDLTPAFGQSIDLVLNPRSEDPAAPRFDYGDSFPSPHIISLPASEEDSTWREALARELKSVKWGCCLTNLLGVPSRCLRTEIEGQRLNDGAAFLAEVLRNADEGTRVVALAPVGITLHRRTAPLRAWLATNHFVEWLIYFGPEAANLLCAHPHFATTVLVIRAGPQETEGPRNLRLVNLFNNSRAEWPSAVSACAKRQGGEVGSSIVLRNLTLDDAPWTYERFSKRFAAKQQDAQELGELRPLGEFVEDIRGGLHRALDSFRVRELDDTGLVPENAIPCFGGRSIELGGRLGSPICAVQPEGLSKNLLLNPGDMLVRSILCLRQGTASVLAAMVTKDSLPATFDRTCIRLRWKSDLSVQVATLLGGYLNSTHARDWLIAHGVQNTLSVDILRQLEVPHPSNEVLKALQMLADAESQYQSWAAEVADARGGIFASTSLQDQVALLLRRQRIEAERLQAARDAESYQYKIRNYFPHPVAYRRELIAQEPPGKQRIDSVLDCAEHLLTLLSFLAILQETSLETGPKRVISKLMSFMRGDSLHLDWGKCVALIQEGAEFTARYTNPLALPFPDLSVLAELMAEKSSPWAVAENRLREWRNQQAHLQRLPEVELQSMSDDFLNQLDNLLQTVTFLSSLPIVHVVDYEFSAVDHKRKATFQMIQGISPVFQRKQQWVSAELPRGALGFLTRDGSFLPASPWLLIEPCPVCKRAEVFAFNRYEGGMPTYVAMETGHPKIIQIMAASISEYLKSRS